MSDPWGLFLAVAAAHALGVSTPGPDWAVVLRQSLTLGRRHGFMVATGIAAGIVFHCGWAFFGLAHAREALPPLIPLIRYGGAAILLLLGIRSLMTAAPSKEPAVQTQAPSGAEVGPSLWNSLGIGLATNLFNPKAALFFLALGAGVASQQASASLRLALSGWLVVATCAFFCVLSAIAGHPHLRRHLSRHAQAIERTMGLLLILLGLWVALA